MIQSNKKEQILIQLQDESNTTYYYPGDLLKGQVLLDLKKSIDVQHISLHFSGYIEGCGDKVILINETILLAKPKDGKKYTTFKSGQQREFDFEFKIPLDKKLPSYFPSIPKIGTISYSLTATHKKPTFKLSHTLSSVTKNLQILDKINILEKGYCTRITKTNEIGFINDNKLAQWSLMISKSAFIRGERIKVDCTFHNFPVMKKQKAVTVSLIRQTHKTSSAKIIESRALSCKLFDLNIDKNLETLVKSVTLKIPLETPPNIFPDSGRILSISYLIQVELNMKSIKVPLKLKPTYTQEITIVIGTFPNNRIQHSTNKQSIINNYQLLPSPTSCSSSCTSSQDIASRYSNSDYVNDNSQQSLGKIPEETITPAYTNPTYNSMENELTPLPKLELDEYQLSSSNKRSYLPPYQSSSSSLTSSTSSPITPPDYLCYQQAFDNYLPSQPERPRQCVISRSKSLLPPIDHILTPLSSKTEKDKNINYSLNRRNTAGNIKRDQQQLQKKMIVFSPPHEIGPNDIIVSPKHHHHQEKTLAIEEEEEEKRQQPRRLSSPPNFLHRQNTLLSSSSSSLDRLYIDFHQTTDKPITTYSIFESAFL